MALPATFLDELRARTPLAALVGRRVRLARSGRQWKGCCPFHDEKTPSFYVYEDGFHCFGCGANGDAIGFVMRAQGAGFIEAVGQLAGEAGLEVPKATPEAAAAERRRLDLHGTLDAAASLFARRLYAPEGQAALDYLRGRGVSDASIATFGLGWSGEGRGALAAELAGSGATPALLAEGGLLTGEGRAFFFNRVTFPIHDAQGRVIGFGGRVLGDAQPKYLNGPETALFAKRRSLYGLHHARAAVRDGALVIVVEGYLDVIALHQAGFAGAVAPLGTALTEEQLAALWKLSPEPVLCFDGDQAGARAAARVARLALPLLEPDRSLRFARLAAGDDPDSLVRRDGARGMAAALEAAASLAEALFDLLRESTGQATPEQRAALRTQLEAAAREVRHKALASELRGVLLDRFFAARRRPGTVGRPGGGASQSAGVGAGVGRPRPSETESDLQRGRILLCLLLRHPAILHDEEDVVGSLPLPETTHRLRRLMLDWIHAGGSLDAAELMDHLRALGCAADAEALTSAVDAILPAGARAGAMPAEALETFWHYVGLVRRSTLAQEVETARDAFARQCDEPSQRRLIALRTAQQRLHAEAGPSGA